jgi:hypothetical protein
MASGASGQAGKNENAEFIVMGSPLQQRQMTRTGANRREHRQAGARTRRSLSQTIRVIRVASFSTSR